MAELVFAVPGDPAQRTGGYLYDARLGDELGRFGWTVRPLRLPDGFPTPDAADLAAADAALAALPDGRLVLIDGLAFSAMPDVVAGHGGRLRLVALIHHPLGYETGLSPERAERLIADERRALDHARHVLVTSVTTRRTLIEAFGVAPGRITVALPGTDPAPPARGSDRAGRYILAVGSVLPRKDFVGLVEAMAPLADRPWTLTIAGSLERDPDEAARLKAAIARLGLGDRVELVGEVDAERLGRLFDRSDLFVSSSRYEGFGMALAEAVARALPIVAVAGGAVGDWLDRRAAVLVDPDAPHGLGDAIARILDRPDLEAALREGAMRARDELPNWADSARAADLALRHAGEVRS